MEFGCCFGAGGRQLFVPLFKPAQVPRRSCLYHTTTRLCEHAAAQARPNPQLHPPSAPLLCSIRGPGARQQPAGPRRAAGGDGSGGNRRHDPPSPRKPAPTAGPTQRGGCGSGRAAGPQSRGGRSPRATGANKKTPKPKPQLKPPTKQTEKGNHHRDPRSREKRSREARSLSAILEA